MGIDRTTGEPAAAAAGLSANEPVYSVRFEPVRLLMLNEGASPVARDHEELKDDELWQGDAFDPIDPQASTVPVYLRLGQRPALVAELVCGCIARALDLPAPEVFLLTVPAGHLPGSRQVNHKGSTLCVATRDIGGETFAQFLTSNGDAALHLLRHWPEIGKVVAFDEWLANPDRNLGNLLYVAQTLHIIDHAEAFGGSTRDLYPLAEMTGMQFANKLAGFLRAFNPAARNDLLEQLHMWLSETVADVNVQEVMHQAGTHSWNTAQQDRELIDFIEQRLTITHSLLCNRLGHPQLSLTAP